VDLEGGGHAAALHSRCRLRGVKINEFFDALNVQIWTADLSGAPHLSMTIRPGISAEHASR